MVELRVAFTKYLKQYSQEPNKRVILSSMASHQGQRTNLNLSGFILTVQNRVRLKWYITVKNNEICIHFEGLILHWYLKKYELKIGIPTD